MLSRISCKSWGQNHLLNRKSWAVIKENRTDKKLGDVQLPASVHNWSEKAEYGNVD